MGMNKTLSSIILGALLSFTPSVKGDRYIYDDFSSGILDNTRWDVRQDPEGEPFMDEFDVRNEDNEYIFHTRQNTIGDRRVYLVPQRRFQIGDSISYDVNVVSAEGHWGHITILDSDRAQVDGIVGYNNGPQPYDELGLSHVVLSFQPNTFRLERYAPSGQAYIDEIPYRQVRESYELYIGSFSGHNGIVHIDYDNFVLTINKNNLFIRGDANMDGSVDISDAIKNLLYLFDEQPLSCQDAADANDDGKIDLSDPVFLLNNLFKGGQQIPSPNEPGTDDTLDKLTCK